ncbi:MAG: hypothetical protein ACXW3U_07865, partial [Rhodoplanes sp.]
MLAFMSVAAGQERPPLPAMPSTGGVGAVSQSVNAELTPEQKTAIAQAVKQSDRKVVVPPGVTAQVGSRLSGSCISPVEVQLTEVDLRRGLDLTQAGGVFSVHEIGAHESNEFEKSLLCFGHLVQEVEEH